MSCTSWSRLAVRVEAIDELAADERLEILRHIGDCRYCRRRAFEIDRSLVFDALPPVPVSAQEVEGIRTAVHTLRRASDVGRQQATHGWVGRAAAIAALLCVALLLDPRQPDEVDGEVPFAGALGVGAGQLDLSRSQLPATRSPVEAADRDMKDRRLEIENEDDDAVDHNAAADEPTESTIQVGDAAKR